MSTRRAPEGWSSWNAAAGVELHSVQSSILERALDLLAPGGRLVYSTCALNPLENEVCMHTHIRSVCVCMHTHTRTRSVRVRFGVRVRAHGQERTTTRVHLFVRA